MLRFDERVHLPKNRENTITFLVNGEPIGTVETLAPGAKTVDIPVPTIDYDSVTDALGYIPYDSTNPSGYITSSALTNYVTTNTNQTITAGKSFHNAELLTDNFITLNGATAYLRGQSGINYYNLMNLNSSGITVGSVNQPIKIVGNATRPQYNSNDLALYSDIPSLSNYLENTATGSESLTLLGTVATNANALNIGVGSQATTTNSLALGDYASAEQVGAIAIYSSENSAHRARANGYGSIAIGRNALAINANYNIAIGDNAIAQNTNSIQLGNGNNTGSNTFQVMSYRLLDTSTGLIPDARISSNIARLTDIPTVTVDQVYDATSANAQSGVAIAGAGFLTNLTSSDVTNGLGYTPVNKAGDTMTGNLTIKNNSLPTLFIEDENNSKVDYFGIEIKDNSFDVASTTAPATTINSCRLVFRDKNGTSSAWVQNRHTAGDDMSMTMGMRRTVNGTDTISQIVCGVRPSGTAYCNFPNSFRVDGQWTVKNTAIATTVTWDATSHSSTKNYSLSSYLPNDDYDYEVIIRANGTTASTSGKWISVGITSDIITTQAFVCRCRTRTASTQNTAGTIILPVGSGRRISVAGTTDASSDGTYDIRCLGYRRIGLNA